MARKPEIQYVGQFYVYGSEAKAVAPKKKKSVKGLVITVCVELAGIVGIVAYWLIRLL